MNRSPVSMVAAALVALAGSVACTGPSGPPGQAPVETSDARVADNYHRIGSWDSTTSGALPTQVAIPGGREILLRMRCSGSGEFTVRVEGAAFWAENADVCDGRWRMTGTRIPFSGPVPEPGPYPANLKGPSTVTSWELEAYDINHSTPTPSA